jgi:hypothetical protein
MSADIDVLAKPAVALDESQHHLVQDLARSGQVGRAAELCQTIWDEELEGQRWLIDQIISAMEERDLTFAGNLAAILTGIERGSEWHPVWLGGRIRPIPEARLSVGKLRHDLEQFQYLRHLGICEAPLDKIISDYESAIDRLSHLGIDTRAPLTAEEDRTVGRAFGRLVHFAETPRVKQALSSSWDRERIQSLYLTRRPSVVVIDDFLTKEALESLLCFCQNSTIWAGNRYAHGRLSALFFTGFNAPLILQIAEELRDAFPLLIGDKHPLRQLWAFKNTDFLPPDSTIHADFAAININFWITPDSANLDPSTGGMVVYDLEAPFSWGFRQYNERPDMIRQLIARHRPRIIRIPYRQNRAIIFNSDLFHATEAVYFRPNYIGSRINVTMLYGDRRLDEHHTEPGVLEQPALCAAWRSGAFSHRRR